MQDKKSIMYASFMPYNKTGILNNLLNANIDSTAVSHNKIGTLHYEQNEQ